jgi:hypothetical protein
MAFSNLRAGVARLFEPSPRLDEHMYGTYVWLRLGLAITAALFPFTLICWGSFRHGLDVLPSMSAYYFAANEKLCGLFPLRDLYVGFLSSISLGLFLYKGYSKAEDWLLNFAGIAGVTTALVPMEVRDAQVAICPSLGSLQSEQTGHILNWHGLGAGVMFVCLAIVCWRCAGDTLKIKTVARRLGMPRVRFFARLYFCWGAMMLVAALMAWAGKYRPFETVTLWTETVGILAFAAYWATKSWEFSLSRTDQHAVKGFLNRRAGASAASIAVNPLSAATPQIAPPPHSAAGAATGTPGETPNYDKLKPKRNAPRLLKPWLQSRSIWTGSRWTVAFHWMRTRR